MEADDGHAEGDGHEELYAGFSVTTVGLCGEELPDTCKCVVHLYVVHWYGNVLGKLFAKCCGNNAA